MNNHPSGLELARRIIGQPRDAVPTPALLVDLPRVKANVQEMARRMAGLPAALRPHAKIHKSPILGRMQVEAGAIGLTTATVWEGKRRGRCVALTIILVANQVVGPVKAGELGRIAGLANVTCAVDSFVNITELSQAAVAAKSQIDVIVEVDVGLHRSGARSAEAADLGIRAAKLPGVRLRGLLGYEVHCSVLEPDRALRIEKASAATRTCSRGLRR